MNDNMSSIIDGLKNSSVTQYGALMEYKSVVSDTVDAAAKDTKKKNITMDDLDDIPVEDIENTENITVDDIKKESDKDSRNNVPEPKKVVEAKTYEGKIKPLDKDEVLKAAGLEADPKKAKNLGSVIKDIIGESTVNEEDSWITIKGTHVQVDNDGNLKNEKLKEKIEATSKGSGKKKEAKGSEKSETKSTKKSSGKLAKAHDDLAKSLDKMTVDNFDESDLENSFRSFADKAETSAKESLGDDEDAKKIYDSPEFGVAALGAASALMDEDIDSLSDGDIKSSTGMDDLDDNDIKTLKKSLKDMCDGLKTTATQPDISYDDDEEAALIKMKDSIKSQAKGMEKMLQGKADFAKAVANISRRHSNQ